MQTCGMRFARIMNCVSQSSDNIAISRTRNKSILTLALALNRFQLASFIVTQSLPNASDKLYSRYSHLQL